MADSISVVSLNKGLDQVSPPLAAEQGSLLDCLNYEMTDTAGYRRIDGYERYDGYPNGAIYEYYAVAITAVNPLDQASIIPGAVISRTGTSTPSVDIGVVLSTATDVAGTYYYDIAPFGSVDQFTLTEEFLLLSDGDSFMELSDGEGLLSVLGEGSDLGDTFTITVNGSTFEVTIDSSPVAGRDTATADEYLTNLRAYSSVLRGLVQDMPTPIAGVYWFEDRLLASINLLEVTITVPTGNDPPDEGVLLRWNGTVYRNLKSELVTVDVVDTYLLHLAVVETTATVDDDLVEVAVGGVAVATWLAAVTTDGLPSTADSTYAQLVYCNNPNISSTRGYTYLPVGSEFTFNLGSYSGTLTPSLTLADGDDPEDAYYIVGDAGATVLKVRLTKVIQQSGTWSAGDAEGTGQLIVIETETGTRDYIINGDELHSEYPTTGTSRILTINTDPTMSLLAGTGSLDSAGTKYVWSTHNFYGQAATLSAYGATGCGRAFWANENGYGNIVAVTDESLDKPKYVEFHVGKLALGYSKGSVLLSVVGEPHNFEGSQGALEIATGDTITGLVSLPGDTLAVFGRRSIRKITGSTDADTLLGTIASRSSCFDYTACSIGQDTVFTGVNGITTLQQTAAYGDFKGLTISDSISTWLRPKLVRNRPGFEVGGVVCAFPVRSKSQYRLVLESGEVVVATFTSEGPRITLSRWGLTGSTRIPYAWSSEVSADGLERMHVVWDESTLRTRILELDTGWGFDGRVFQHYFDLCHMFVSGAAVNIGVEKCRLYGQGYGVATLDIKSSGIESDFFQDYHDTVQDISMPATPEVLYTQMRPVTSIIDQANWGLGIKLRVQGSNAENSTLTEPSHICQVLVLHMRTQGAVDG